MCSPRLRLTYEDTVTLTVRNPLEAEVFEIPEILGLVTIRVERRLLGPYHQTGPRYNLFLGLFGHWCNTVKLYSD